MRIKCTALILCALAGTALAGLDAASTITLFEASSADQRPNLNISVYPGRASYMSRGLRTVSGRFGEGTILDFRFFNGWQPPQAGFLTVYADGEPDLLGNASAGAVNRAGDVYTRLWLISDPGPDFKTPPDISGNSVARTFTSAVAQDITGTIDISKLREGSVFIIYGSFKDSCSLSMTMSGGESPDITARHTEPHGTSRIHLWMTEFRFSDAQEYDTLTYTYTHADQDGSRAHFIGVLLDAERPLGTLGLIN